MKKHSGCNCQKQEKEYHYIDIQAKNTYIQLPSHQRRSWSQSSCTLPSSNGNSSTLTRSFLVEDSSTLPYPVCLRKIKARYTIYD